ncbi:Uncharacterised protein [Mycobacterium tuberculosis]|nr:Uncharacterised protein [Mycobacterium tuberculosis]
MASKSAWVTDPGRQTQKRDYRGRRTQNPERGRKLKTVLHCNPEFLHVVRPKTPRGDGNLE